jgi:hypothetical protein
LALSTSQRRLNDDLPGKTCAADSLYGNALEGILVAQTLCQAAPDCQSQLGHVAAHTVLQSFPVKQTEISITLLHSNKEHDISINLNILKCIFLKICLIIHLPIPTHARPLYLIERK